jgi:hypothetical protein
MPALAVTADWVRQARGLPTVLDAAYGGFEAILTVIGAYEDTTSSVLAPFLLAATQAANGRDALLFAPSLPPRSHRRHPAAGEERGSTGGIGSAVANLSRLLATQLTTTAATEAHGADRVACHDAARHATRIHDLLAGMSR